MLQAASYHYCIPELSTPEHLQAHHLHMESAQCQLMLAAHGVFKRVSWPPSPMNSGGLKLHGIWNIVVMVKLGGMSILPALYRQVVNEDVPLTVIAVATRLLVKVLLQKAQQKVRMQKVRICMHSRLDQSEPHIYNAVPTPLLSPRNDT